MKAYRKFTDLLQRGKSDSAKPAKPAKPDPQIDTEVPTFAGFATFAESDSVKLPPPAGGRWIMQIQLWGIDQAKELVAELIEAAGPHRAARLDEVFAYYDKQWRVSGATKIARLKEQARLMKADPLHWPHFQTRRTKSTGDREVVLKYLQTGPKTTRWFARKLRNTLPAIAKLLTQMVARGDILDCGPSKWGLPGSSSYAKVTVQVLKALIERPQNPTGLMVTTGHSKSAIGSAVESLRRMGVAVAASKRRGDGWTKSESVGPPTRGGPPVLLTPETLAKVERCEPIRTRRRTILLTGEEIAAIKRGAGQE
jgi:hypothetical protein